MQRAILMIEYTKMSRSNSRKGIPSEECVHWSSLSFLGEDPHTWISFQLAITSTHISKLFSFSPWNHFLYFSSVEKLKKVMWPSKKPKQTSIFWNILVYIWKKEK